MLILSREERGKIMISKNICVTILKNIDGKVDVGISAPKSIPINRLEIINKNKIQEKREQAWTQITK